MKRAALWGVELLVTRGTQIEKNTFDRFQDIFIRIIWLLKNYIPGPHPQKLLIWQTWDGTWGLAWKTGLEQCGTVERSDAFGKPRILHWQFTQHRSQIKGLRNPVKKGSIWFWLIHWFPELSVGLYRIRGEGGSYYKAAKACPWNSVGLLLLWVYCISWEDLIAPSSRNTIWVPYKV